MSIIDVVWYTSGRMLPGKKSNFPRRAQLRIISSLTRQTKDNMRDAIFLSLNSACEPERKITGFLIFHLNMAEKAQLGQSFRAISWVWIEITSE